MSPVPARPTSSISTASPMRHSHPTRPIRRRPSLRLAGVSLEVAIRSGPDPWYGREQCALDRSSDQVLLPTLLSTPASARPWSAGAWLSRQARPRSDPDSGAPAGSSRQRSGRYRASIHSASFCVTRRRPSNGLSALVGRGNGRRSARRAICAMTAKRLRRRMAARRRSCRFMLGHGVVCGRVEEIGELLDSVNQPGSRPCPRRVRIHRNDLNPRG
jgi:hypothetical protein